MPRARRRARTKVCVRVWKAQRVVVYACTRAGVCGQRGVVLRKVVAGGQRLSSENGSWQAVSCRPNRQANHHMFHKRATRHEQANAATACRPSRCVCVGKSPNPPYSMDTAVFFSRRGDGIVHPTGEQGGRRRLRQQSAGRRRRPWCIGSAYCRLATARRRLRCRPFIGAQRRHGSGSSPIVAVRWHGVAPPRWRE